MHGPFLFQSNQIYSSYIRSLTLSLFDNFDLGERGFVDKRYGFFIDLATNLHRLAPALLTPARSESVVRIGLTDRPPGLALVLRTDSKRNKGAEGKEGKNSHTALLFSRLPMPSVTTRDTLFGRIIYMQLVSWVYYTPTFVVLAYKCIVIHRPGPWRSIKPNLFLGGAEGVGQILRS